MKKFNISLDDYSPREGTNDLYWCNKLIEKYPDVKINLFVPAAYCRLGEKPCYLSENLDWVDSVKNLPINYRINFHGMYHRRIDGKNPDSNNDEFQFLNRIVAKSVIGAMINEFTIVGLKYCRTFRPPGWKISKSAVEELISRKFLIAGDRVYYDMYKGKIEKLNKFWVSYNWDLTSECIEDGNVCAYGHTSNWTNNFMNEDRYNLILRALDKRDFEFKWIEDML